MSFQQFKQELSTWLTSLGAGQVSKEFFELIKNIGEARSKQEESAIILKESQQLKQALAQPIDNKKKLREVLIRMVYCEMLGVPVPYAYVTALSATQEAKTSEKKVAYICASLCLRGVGEWSVLATNSLRRDLENSSILDQWAALGALSALVTRETAPALVEPTCALLQHSRALIRKWTVHAIGHFIALHEHVIDEDSTGVEEELEAGHGLWSKLLAALYDKDPAVMMAVVSVLQPLIAKYGARFNPKTRRELLSALSAIQKQVLDHHLKDYDYHRVAAPWLQISLLKIFGALGHLDAGAARDLYHVLHETLNKSIAYLTHNTDTASYNAAYAVLHETVNTIVRVYKHAANDRNTEALVDEAATHVSHMLTFDPKSGVTAAASTTRRTTTQDPNLKYLALHSLSDLIEINPRHVIQHQVLLFKCLNDPDDSIQRKTLELLYKMTGPKNITLVVTKMLAHLKSSTDLYLRRDLIGKITALCEKFAPSPAWYIAAMLKCLYLGAELVQPSHLDQLLTVLQTGTGDLQQDLTLRRHAVKHAMKYLIAKNGNNKPQEQSVPDLLAQVIAWILGEYGNLLRDLEQYRHVTASDMLTDLLDRQYSRGEVRAWILMALAKRVARDWHAAPVSSTTLETVLKYTASRHVVTQQIARDLTNLVTILNNLPRDHVIVSKLATLFDRPVKVDRKLTFLDEYTRQALRQGARDYQRVESSRDTAKSGVQTGREQSLRFETYKAPTVIGNATKSSGSIFEQTAEESKSIFNVPSATTPAAVPSGPLSAASLKQVSGPWSISGYGGAAPKPVAPVTPVAPNNSAPRDPTPSTAAPARSSPSARSRDPVAPVPHQPSQEELMAALLFEGATKKTKAKKKRTPTSTNEHVSDSSSPLHTNEHVTQSSPLNTVNQGSPLNTINQGSPLNTVNQGSVDSLLSFDFNQPVLAANNSTSSVSIFDAFAPSTPDTKELQTLITPIAVSPNLARQLDPTFEDNFDLPNLATTPFIQTEIDGRPRSHEKPQKIANDTQIQINYFHIWQEQSLGVVLFVCNKSDVVLSDLRLTVVPPDNFAVSYRADSVVDLTRVNDHVLTINVIPPHTAVLVLIDLTLSQLIFNPTLSATLTYKTSSHAADKTLKCTAPIDLPDLLRNHTMTTETFGQQWGTHTCETKLVFKNKALSLEQFGQLIHAMNFTQIKVIGKEVIGASRLINTTPTMVLLHAKLEPQQCEVKIRAKDRALSEVVARYFTRILKQ